MIELKVQLISLLYSFLFGNASYIIFSFYMRLFRKQSNKLMYILSIILILFLALLYFIGLLYINNGYLHFYFLLFVLVGYLFLYSFGRFWFTHKKK